jgi:hypothetical protein
MARESTAAIIERDLKLRALGGATLADLLSLVDEEDRRVGGSGLSPEQSEELRLYCWALHKRGSLALRHERERVWGALEYDHIDG